MKPKRLKLNGKGNIRQTQHRKRRRKQKSIIRLDNCEGRTKREDDGGHCTTGTDLSPFISVVTDDTFSSIDVEPKDRGGAEVDGETETREREGVHRAVETQERSARYHWKTTSSALVQDNSDVDARISNYSARSSFDATGQQIHTITTIGPTSLNDGAVNHHHGRSGLAVATRDQARIGLVDVDPPLDGYRRGIFGVHAGSLIVSSPLPSSFLSRNSRCRSHYDYHHHHHHHLRSVCRGAARHNYGGASNDSIDDDCISFGNTDDTIEICGFAGISIRQKKKRRRRWRRRRRRRYDWERVEQTSDIALLSVAANIDKVVVVQRPTVAESIFAANTEAAASFRVPSSSLSSLSSLPSFYSSSSSSSPFLLTSSLSGLDVNSSPQIKSFDLPIMVASASASATAVVTVTAVTAGVSHASSGINVEILSDGNDEDLAKRTGELEERAKWQAWVIEAAEVGRLERC